MPCDAEPLAAGEVTGIVVVVVVWCAPVSARNAMLTATAMSTPSAVSSAVCRVGNRGPTRVMV